MLNGDEGNDTLSGGAGNDGLDGGIGNDTLSGGANNDTLNGDSGDDALFGGDGDDNLRSGDGIDRLDGGAGNDTISGNGGSTIIGGGGDDIVYLNNANGGISTVDGGGGTDKLYANGDMSKMALSGFEELAGNISSYDIRITAAQLNSFSIVNAIAITLATAGTVGANFDNGFRARLSGSVGNDIVSLGHITTGSWIVNGQGGDDRITTGAGNDGLDGGIGNDTLSGGANNDTLNGDSGDDALFGGDGDDNLRSGDGIDRLDGGAGNDTISGNGGSTIIGGGGDDIVYLNNANGGISTVDGGGGTDKLYVNGDMSKMALSGFEELAGNISSSDIQITAAQLNSFSIVNAIAITLATAGTVGANFDNGFRARLSGSVGNDIVSLGHITTGSWSVNGQGGDDRITTGAGNDGLDGGIGNDTLRGGAGNDILKGDSGLDYLDGGAGADSMQGGAGNDTYVVDHVDDRVAEIFPQDGHDIVYASVSWSLAAGQNVEDLHAVAGTRGITLKGNERSNSLHSGAGSDRLEGGAGDDDYHVNDARDIVVEAAGQGRDTVAATVSYALAAGQEIESLRLLGSANLNLTGNAFGQSLTGNAGTNVLNGGLGADALIGGKGADTFVFAATLGTGNVDRIADFAADDTIQLSKSVFAALAPGQLTAGALKSLDRGKIDADDRILYKQSTGELFYDADGSGKAAAVKFAVLDNKVSVTAADFLIA